jgi:SAM-dependent methyltransferase
MTTLPPEPAELGPPTAAATLAAAARQRRVAESFGADAERYNRARPGYPEAMVDRIVAASPGRDVVDAGCGTGISARLFQAAGCRVLGVDPDPRMADLARGSGLAVEVAKFEDWDAAGRTFDAVIAGQAWHWVNMTAGAAKAAAVLRPSGRLAVFWNAFDPPAELREAFGAVYQWRGLPAGGARLADGGRVLVPARLRPVPGDVRYRGRRDASGGRVRRPADVAVRLVPPLHPGAVARSGTDLRRPRAAAG